MANESVGKITLDLELNSNINKQLEETASKIGEQLKASLQNVNFNPVKISDTVNAALKLATQNALSVITNTIDEVIGDIDAKIEANITTARDTILNTIKQIKEAAAESIKYIAELLSKIKMPQQKFSLLSNIVMPSQNVTAKVTVPRAPPMPKLNTGVNMEAIKAQMDNLTNSLDTVNARIEQQQAKLASLKESYANTFNEARKNKLQEEILKTETSINKLIAASDKAGFKLADLDSQFEILNRTSKNAAAGINVANESIGRTAGAATKAGSSLKKAAESGNEFKLFGGIMDSFGNKISNMGKSITNAMSGFVKWMVIFPLAFQAVQTLGGYIGSALMTNAQFANSLLQIKTNLEVAFMPIYQAILPALNALMSALSRVTAYIAAFISVLFGKTYQASYGAAQNLNASVASMKALEDQSKKTSDAVGGVGDSAKKAAKGSLASFDEINQLQINNPDENKSPEGGTGAGVADVPALAAPSVDLSPTSAAMQNITNMINGIKDLVGTILQPFQQAWASQGQATIASIKNSLNGIWNLIKSIGQSFLTVWTNGTGKAILSTMLQILQNIFNTIGDIANTFAKAWNSGSIGTSIIQGLANTVENLLTLIKKIGDSFKQAWGVVGTGVANTFMQVLNSTGSVLENISQKLGWVWDNGGSHLFESLIKLGAKIIEIAGYIYTNFVAPFINWFVDFISPAVAKVMDNVGNLLDQFTKMIDWLQGTGKPVLDIIVTVLGSMAIAFGVIQIAILAYNVVTGIATVTTEAFAGVMAFLTSPIGIAIAVIGALIAIGIELYKNWDTISAYLKNIWNDIKTAASDIFKAIGDWISNTFNKVKEDINNIWNLIKSWLNDNWNGIKTAADNIFNAIGKAISDIWNSVKTDASNIWNGIKTFFSDTWDSIKQTAESAWNIIKTLFENVWNGIRQTALNIWNRFKTDFNDFMNGLKSILNGIIDFIMGIFTGNWKKAWEGVKEIFKGVFDSLYSIVKVPLNLIVDAINTVIRGLNSIHFTLPSWIPGLGGQSFGINIPSIPHLAQGGIIDQPTLAMIGEAHKKEAVVPLEDTSFADAIASAVATAVLQAIQFARSGSNPVGKNNGDIILKLDGTVFARLIKPYLDREQNRLGNSMIIKTT